MGNLLSPPIITFITDTFTLLIVFLLIVAIITMIFAFSMWSINHVCLYVSAHINIDPVILTAILFNRYSLALYILLITFIYMKYHRKPPIIVINTNRQINTSNLHRMDKGFIRSNAERLAFARNINKDLMSYRTCDNLNHDNSKQMQGVPYYLLPCGHFLCNDCKLNQMEQPNPAFAVTCPVQECIDGYSPYLSEDYIFEVGHFYNNRNSSFCEWILEVFKDEKINQDAIFSKYIRDNTVEHNLSLPQVIYGLLFQFYRTDPVQISFEKMGIR